MASKFKLEVVLGIAKLPEYLQAVDKLLLEYIYLDPSIGNTIEPLIKAGGKRLRPSLVIACANLNHKKINHDVFKLAATVELVHIGSLVHDDIIDGAKSRWNIPTINNTNPNLAILVGDYLQAMACAIAAEAGSLPAQLTAITISKLCSGQALELKDKNNTNRTQANYFNTINGKTAALISLSCVLGGMNANLSEKQIKSLQEFGENFGLAFQLIDDLLDLVSTDQLYGKPVGNDIAEKIFTLPIILGLKNTPDLLNYSKSDVSNELIKSGAMFEVINQIHHYNLLAAAALDIFKNAEINMLKNLPANYFDWTLNNLVKLSYRPKLLEMQKM